MQANKDIRLRRDKGTLPNRVRYLIWHELIGLYVEVFWSKNKDYEKVKGTVIDETKNMLIIRNGEKVKKVPKNECIFRFKLEDYWVYIDGALLVGRPEERLKKEIVVRKIYFERLANAFLEKMKVF